MFGGGRMQTFKLALEHRLKTWPTSRGFQNLSQFFLRLSVVTRWCLVRSSQPGGQLRWSENQFFWEKSIFWRNRQNSSKLEKSRFRPGGGPKPEFLPPNQRLIKIATLREERGVMGTCARDFGHKMSRFWKLDEKRCGIDWEKRYPIDSTPFFSNLDFFDDFLDPEGGKTEFFEISSKIVKFVENSIFLKKFVFGHPPREWGDPPHPGGVPAGVFMRTQTPPPLIYISHNNFKNSVRTPIFFGGHPRRTSTSYRCRCTTAVTRWVCCWIFSSCDLECRWWRGWTGGRRSTGRPSKKKF